MLPLQLSHASMEIQTYIFGNFIQSWMTLARLVPKLKPLIFFPNLAPMRQLLQTASSSGRPIKASNGLEDASIELDERKNNGANVHAGSAEVHLHDGRPSGSGLLQLQPPPEGRSGYVGKLEAWWSRNISLCVQHNDHGPLGGDPRDYLALERTFLGWMRTATALVSLGVVITQLFILRNLDPTAGKILGALFALGGVCIALVGCIRYFRHQSLLTQGKTLSGGWHVLGLLALLGAILSSLFIIILVEG